MRNVIILCVLWCGQVQAQCPVWGPARAERELTVLAKQLSEWDQAYYQQDLSKVADEHYDAMEKNFMPGNVVFNRRVTFVSLN